MNKEALLEKVRHSDQLPMLPDVAVRIIDMSNDNELYAAKISEIIANDAVLSARLLQVSNSSIFPFRHEITNLNQALAILGIQLTMSIAIGFAIIDMMRSRETKDSGFNHDAFWRKSVLSAIAAIEMRSELSGVEQGDLFVAALMQDIGMIGLETFEGKKYTQLVNGARSHLDLLELERRMFGIDHAEIGTDNIVLKTGTPWPKKKHTKQFARIMQVGTWISCPNYHISADLGPRGILIDLHVIRL